MFRLANPLWGFALLVKVMTAKRPGLEVVTNFSFLGDKMDGTADRGKKFQENFSFNTMTQVILQIHSAVLTYFGRGRGGGCYSYLHFNAHLQQWMSISIGKKYPQGTSVLWVGIERSYIGILKKISGCPCCRHKATLQKREAFFQLSNESGYNKRGKKRCLGFFQLLWHTAILICNPAIQKSSWKPLNQIHNLTWTVPVV